MKLLLSIEKGNSPDSERIADIHLLPAQGSVFFSNTKTDGRAAI